ncbi:exocyst complex component 6-like isoform X2 [Oppia nitens]|uniref:exocyst complex component 6-like isoform X2 n=1 Tax=Oppia nitens TaxID=1686743 RepID=UPI0023DCE1F1|nr:exocyst complex component 6-like isoform X2 [Oppia nitens]
MSTTTTTTTTTTSQDIINTTARLDKQNKTTAVTAVAATVGKTTTTATTTMSSVADYVTNDHKFDNLIVELESSDINLATVLRAIYDGDEHQKFMEKLDARIRNHDKDIERMCNCHYQGFVDCIHELLQVRPQVRHLNEEIVAINNELQKSSDSVIRKADELIKYRRVVANTSIAIDHLQQCLPVLDMYTKLESQMDERKYYPALKTLEQLETTYLPRVAKYRFAQTMCEKIPQIREQIKTVSMTDLKDFLENIRKMSIKIGELSMRTVAHQQNIADAVVLNNNQSATTQLSSQYNNTSAVLNNNNNTGTTNVVTNGGGFNNNINNNNDDSDYNSDRQQPNNRKPKPRKRRAPPPPSTSSSSSMSTTTGNPFGDDNHEDTEESTNTESDANNTASEEELSATDLVDFSPVYRCLHIFGCLGAREQFEQYYRQQRLQQAKLALQQPIQMNDVIDGYNEYLCGVVGFFVIEDHIMNTSNGLVIKTYLAEVWENALQTIIASMRTHLSYCTDPNLMLKIKRLIMLFSYTLQSYGYNVSLLLNLFIEMRDQYNDILMKHWVNVFKTIFDSDNYHPIQVNNLQEYVAINSEFPFYESEVVSCSQSGSSSSGQEFPKKFPFSLFVPKVYKEVKQFIFACLKFSEDLNLNQTEIEDRVRKSTNLLLTRTLNECLSSLIKKHNLGLLQLIQITINTNYLEESSIYLEDFITKTINQSSVFMGTSGVTSPTSLVPSSTSSSANDTSHLARLQGRTMFKDIRSDAESQIYLRLNQKIDEFLDLANYDWLLVESPGMASAYISDLIAFLKSTFQAFTNLPLKVAQTACLSACKHISSSLLNFLMDEEVKCISWGVLQQFNLDLIQCELFASSEPVREFEEGSLQMCFAELRQLMDLFTEIDSWSNYFADYGKQESRYLRVNPQTALTLMEKLREGEKKKGTLFASLTKNEREKKNKTDTVVKKLKQLIINNNVNQ